MRYLKVTPNTTTDEEVERGIVNGTLEVIQGLLTRSPELRSYENQIQLYKLAMKFDKYRTSVPEDNYLEVEEKEYEWIKKVLKAGVYSAKNPMTGQEQPIIVGKILSDVEDLPNRKLEVAGIKDGDNK